MAHRRSRFPLRTSHAVRISSLTALASGLALGIAGLQVSPARAERPLLMTGLAFDVGAWRPGIDPSKAGRPYAAAAGDLDGDGRPDLVTANFDDAIGGAGAGNTVSVLLSDAAPIIRLFRPKANYPTGIGPNRVAMADFNVDGRLDVVTANASGSVSFLRGDGVGGLAPPITAGFATNAAGLVAALIDGDGKPDLVVAHSAGSITSLRGNGDGTFTSVGTFNTFAGALRNIAIGDLNGDGRLDIVTANEGSNTFSLFLGNGLGGFGLFTTVPTAALPQDVAIGDVTGDGNADVVVAPGAITSILVHPGTGGGGFLGAFVLAVGTDGPWSVEIADLSADGTNDIVVSCVGGSLTNSTNLAVFTNLGGGLFDLSMTDAGIFPGQVVVSDLNADTWLDVAVPTWAPSAQTHTALVFLNRNGSIASLRKAPVGLDPSRSAIADLNCDGSGDMVVLDGSDLEIHIGSGNGTFAPYSLVGIPGPPVHGRLAVGDVNRDSDADILVTAGGAIYRYYGNGDGTFGGAAAVYAGLDLLPRSIADMNRDGRPDLVLSDPSGPSVEIALQDAAGNYAPSATVALAFPIQDLVVADLDRDGRLDVALALALNGGAPTDGGLFVLKGAGDGTISAPIAVGAPRQYHAICAGDFDRNAIPDLAARERVTNADDAIGGATYFLGTGGFAYATGVRLPLIDRGGSFLESWDLNGDGTSDLVASSGQNDAGTDELASLGVYLGDGVGHFGMRTDYGVGGWPDASATYGWGDLDRDNRPDLTAFVRHTAGGGPTQWFVKPVLSAPIRENVALGPKTDYAMGAPQELAVGDLNRDGKLDVVVPSTVAGGAAVRLGLGDGTLGPAASIPGSLPSQCVRLGDFNRDGILDLAAVSIQISIHIGVGNGTFLSPPVTYFAGDSDDLELADFNRDAKLDLVAGGGGDDFVYVFEGVGDGTFAAAATIFVGSGLDVEVGDTNCDGLTEIMVANGNLITLYASGDLTWFGPVADVPAHPIGAIHVADLNHDGKADVAAAASSTNHVLTFFSSGLFFYSTTGDETIAFLPTELMAGDTSADGVPDLFVVSRAVNAATVLRGVPPFGYDTAGAVVSPTGTMPLGVALGDFNRDALLDVATANAGSSDVSILLRGDHSLTGVEVAETPGARVALAQNQPNPFNPSTKIRFRVGAAGPARLEVYDVSGRRVATLVDRAVEAGDHVATWNGRRDDGSAAASGVYFYRLDAAGEVESKKMVLSK